MKKVFLDTNVFLDFLLNRGEFAKASEIILLWCEDGRLEGYTSVVSFANIYYLTGQQKSITETKRIIRNLLDFIRIPVTSKKDLLLAIDSDFSDFEDAIQYYSAMNIDSMDFIVTRNKKDFKNSSIPVVTTEEFIDRFS